MKKTLKTLLYVALLLVIAGAAVGYYMWNKPHAKVEDAKGITISAAVLAKEYAAGEPEANTKYLNKPIEVSGTVAELEKNQDGGLMIVLQTEDPSAGVQCAMREKNATAEKGHPITLKGFCSGNGITGVSLTDCIIIK